MADMDTYGDDQRGYDGKSDRLNITFWHIIPPFHDRNTTLLSLAQRQQVDNAVSNR